jgi:hypothetical protein
MDSYRRKAPLVLDKTSKRSHCLELYILLEYTKRNYSSSDSHLQAYAQLFNAYYTHCEYESNNLKLKIQN